MTYSDLLDIFKNTYPFMKVTNYRPVCHELFEDGKEGCTIWLDNGDMVVYYPNQERGDAVNEMMTFPDTWEEFEKSYGFTDNEEVYTNGARLIPSFRVKQWKDHLSSEEPQKWILCSERMPEEHDSIFSRFYGTEKWRDAMFRKTSDTVICTVQYRDGTRQTAPCHTIDGEWNQSMKGMGKVLAWMPLPEPWKGEEE